jgi:hypothetical protein
MHVCHKFVAALDMQNSPCNYLDGLYKTPLYLFDIATVLLELQFTQVMLVDSETTTLQLARVLKTLKCGLRKR